jgi:hypothetical protein
LTLAAISDNGRACDDLIANIANEVGQLEFGHIMAAVAKFLVVSIVEPIIASCEAHGMNVRATLQSLDPA